MPSSSAEKNLLFGFLALQMDFITPEQLVAATSTWVLDKSRPLSQILRDQRSLDEDTLAVLETLVRKHLEIHDNDPEKSLAAVSSIGPVGDKLKGLGDSDVAATLGHVKGVHADAPSPTTSFRPGSSLPPRERFRILRPHAKGGIGRVSVAHDEELHREVAFKELLEDRDNPDHRSRFVLEAEITGSLEHPGIVPVYGLGRHIDGRPFYAMRFIRGESLKKAISKFHKIRVSRRDPGQRLRFRKLLRCFIAVCNAIQYAHSRGVVHRDLKPENVMLGKFGETLVVDWGLAKSIHRLEKPSSTEQMSVRPTPPEGFTETQPGKALGTPAYMSPEQAEGRLDLIGPATDVYGLGATLHTLLTNRRPFHGTDVTEVLEKVREGEFRRPRDLNPHVARGLEAICLKAMALKPEDRYPTPRKLAKDIERWLADEPVSAYQDTLGERVGRSRPKPEGSWDAYSLRPGASRKR